jgi:predicted GH43/DUF377 family glycosyl hydrolase
VIEPLAELRVSVERLGMVLSPDRSEAEREGVLNPAFVRARDGRRVLYPRAVATGNISRIERVHLDGDAPSCFVVRRDGFALEPDAPYERRSHPGYGCEDPRVTFVPVLDAFVMAYTAFGPRGPRIAIACSQDGYAWERLGLMHFGQPGMTPGDDKDAAFFPEPVTSPTGVVSLAFYHRPMLHLSAVDGRAAIPMIERLPYEDRESIRVGYVPLDPVLRDRRQLLEVNESVLVLSPNEDWGALKIGAGTPPVRIAQGWMSLYHAVDVLDDSGVKPAFRYSAGIVIHDYEQPHRVLFRSPAPVLAPESDHERNGIVDNVVFPTGIDERSDIAPGCYDIYYGMADYRIGAARMILH